MPGVPTSNRSSSIQKRSPEICDALIIGGGPAGLAASIAMRQRGLDVVVVDALNPPIDKACGEGLVPEAVRELAMLRVDLSHGRPFSGLHFADRSSGQEDLTTAAFSLGNGIGISRKELHRALLDRAEETGVRLKWGARVDLSGTRVTVGGEPFRYRYLIGADGESSRVRRWAGLEAGSLRSERLGFRRYYRVAPWSEQVEVHWCDFGQAYVTPIAEDEVCVVALTRRRDMNFDKILEQLPWLVSKLRSRPALGRDRGAVTKTRKLKRVTRGNVALVGDASGSSDAVTGQGLACAFREAQLLADALNRDSIADYEAGHAGILRLPQAMAAGLLMMDRSSAFRHRVMRAFAAQPSLFAGLLAVHTGEERLGHFVSRYGAQLGFQLLLGPSRSAPRQSASHLHSMPATVDDPATLAGETTTETWQKSA